MKKSPGRDGGIFKKDARSVTEQNRFRPGKSDVEELLVGYEKLNKLTGWEPEFDWDVGLADTINWYAENRESWLGRNDGLVLPTRLTTRPDGGPDAAAK